MKIHFASLGDVQEFVGLASLQPYAVQVQDKERTVNAKSFMEMFTLDFSEPLSVTVSGDENETHFAHAAKKFLV
ncbi:MAG: HPr family phosphocarrier protein [Oscillospiraceae bacterium]|nr:HPr family phosphocarrier protein [Oscillospiraceae bacterium]